MDVYEDQVRFQEEVPPTPALARFLDALAEQLPDDPDTGAPLNPWASMPLRVGAKGPIVILNVRWDYVQEVLRVVPTLAHEHALVCFDLQEETVL